jgi:hypothetical protein
VFAEDAHHTPFFRVYCLRNVWAALALAHRLDLIHGLGIELCDPGLEIYGVVRVSRGAVLRSKAEKLESMV